MKNQLLTLTTAALLVASCLAGCVTEGDSDDDDAPYSLSEDGEGKADGLAGAWVGSPLDSDPGPMPGDGWAELFAQVPNYRTLSRALGASWLVVDPATGKTKLQVIDEQRAAQDPPLDPIPEYTLTKDKFRYEMGPIFYRGRLDGTAHVLVVGQDAATDEALVSRAFVGGTGQKVQALLNQIGITKSYICLNTFIYSIYEQYDEFTEELATGTAIKDYRNQLFDKVLRENHIDLIVSFGAAAHESVQIYRDEMLGGKLPANVRWVKFMHPGAAGVDPNQIKAVAASFAHGWKSIWSYRRSHPGWLPLDPDARKYKGSTYYYVSNDIPYRDLPYGVTRELGTGGTKSERGSSGLRVQLRSANGARYEAPDVAFPKTASKSRSGLALGSEDLTWEPSKSDPLAFDRGPTRDWVELLATTPPLAQIEAEAGIDVATDFVNPIWYRGRLDGSPARTLIIAQDAGIDQQIAGRALTGDAGQKINHLLANVGAGTDYVMVNAFPYATANVAPEALAGLITTPSLAAFRDQLLQRIVAEKQPTVVLTFGPLAARAWASAGITASVTWIALADPHDPLAYQSWNQNLPALRAAFGTAETTVSKTYTASGFPNTRAMIPRADLHWGLPMWFGTSGDLSQQADASWLFWNAPTWVNYEPPTPAPGSVPAQKL